MQTQNRTATIHGATREYYSTTKPPVASTNDAHARCCMDNICKAVTDGLVSGLE